MEDLYDPENPRDDAGRTFAAQAAWLREHPWEWATISHEPNYGKGLTIQRGQYALLPKSEFQIRQRRQRDRNKTVYVQARYVGETEEPAW